MKDSPDTRDGCLLIVGVSFIAWVLAAMLLAALWIERAAAQGFHIEYVETEYAIEITNSRGGDIQQAITFFANLDKPARVTGNCLSSCTMVLGLVEEVCWSPTAAFLFHAGHYEGLSAEQVTGMMTMFIPARVLDALPDWREWSAEYTPPQTLTARQMSRVLGKEPC